MSLAALGLVYSVVYSDLAIHPGGFLDKVTAPDRDILTGVAMAKWHEIPCVWWGVAECLSWTMLEKPHSYGRQFGEILK